MSVTPYEVASRCGVNIRTVYFWVKKKYLKGETQFNGIIFSEVDISNIEIFFKTHITIHAAAKEMGMTYALFKKSVISNNVHVKSIFQDDRRLYITREWLRKSQVFHIDKVAGEELVLYKDNLMLFDLVDTDKGKGLIVNVSPLRIKEIDGSISTPQTIKWKSGGFENASQSGLKGNVQITIEKPESILDDMYVAIGCLIKSWGPKNIRVFEKSNELILDCRQGIIPYHQSFRLFNQAAQVVGILTIESENYIIGDPEIRIGVPIKYSSLATLEKVLKGEKRNLGRRLSEYLEEHIINQKNN